MVNFIPESRLLFIESVPFTKILSRQSLKLFVKMGLNKWNKNFRLDHSVRVSRISFPVGGSVATGNFTLEQPENYLSIYISTGISGVCWKMKAPVYMISPFSSSHRPPRGGYYLILIVQKTSKTLWRGEYFTRLRLHIEKVAYNRSLYVVACELVINKIMLTLVFVVIVVFYTECIV